MDAKNLAKLKRQLAKADKKKEEPPKQKPVDQFFQRAEAAQTCEDPEPPKGDAADAEGSQALELKRKITGKGVLPPEKKKKGVADKDVPVLGIEERASSESPAQLADGTWPRENVQFSVKKGVAIVHGTMDPREFLDGATPPLDRSALGRLGDDAIESKLLHASVTASVVLGEHIRRVEQMRLRKAQDDEALRKLVVKNTEAIRKMAELEESLRKATEGMEQKLKAAEAKGRAAAEASAAEAAKTAAIKAEEAQREAVLQAREEAISAFVADGWKV
ncbi:unnamed protein product, partial [Cuscuta epithymum]